MTNHLWVTWLQAQPGNGFEAEAARVIAEPFWQLEFHQVIQLPLVPAGQVASALT